MTHIKRYYGMIFFLLSTLSVSAATINVMTFNIRRDGKEENSARKWQERKSHVLKFLDNTPLDVFGLQEATINQIDDVADKNKNYTWIGKGRGSAWCGTALNEYNPIFYDQKKFTLLASETFSLNKSLLWFLQINRTGFIPRICTWALLENKRTKEQILVFNTHLDHQFKKARSCGLQKVLERITNISQQHPNATVLLMGDFNHDLNSTTEQLRNKGFLNTRDSAQRVKGPHETIHHWGQKKPERIDHILIRQASKDRPLIVKMHETVQEQSPHYLSDHRPVIARLVT